LRDLVQELIQMSNPLPKDFEKSRANCFNAVQLFHSHSDEASFVGPEEFVAYLFKEFIQLPSHTVLKIGDVSVVWSRSSDFLPLGQIDVSHLYKRFEGYPFGLVIEHAFVILKGDSVF
jgi:hypothetical protein